MRNNDNETNQNGIKIGIYKITSPSGKVYIGQAININNRWRQYERLDCKGQPKLYNSLQKHGWNKHIFEIIEEYLLEELNEYEIYWKQQYIDKLGWKMMLFCELHDKGGGPRNEETKLKIGLGNKGRIFSKESRNKISKANKGKVRTKKVRDNFSKMRKGKISHRKGKCLNILHKQNIQKARDKTKISIIQCDLNGMEINRFDGIREAAKVLNIDAGSIVQCCKNRIKTYKKYIWKYENICDNMHKE